VLFLDCEIKKAKKQEQNLNIYPMNPINYAVERVIKVKSITGTILRTNTIK
jgi:hypothetical protein